jgi:hypothetical protein
MEEDLGWVYCLSNPSFRENIFKVGFTKDENLNVRIDKLYTTGVPTPFKLEFAAKFKNCETVERRIHALLEHFCSRVNDQREFFECSPDDVLTAFKSQSPYGEFVIKTDEKVQTKPLRDYKIFSHMQRIRHVKNGDVLYGTWDEMHNCFRLEDDPECVFVSLTAFERYHLEKLDLELKGGGNGWRNCEVEIEDGEWVRASSYQEDKQ